jgi:uncharacterized membrane protein YozB (DUF420 family)
LSGKELLAAINASLNGLSALLLLTAFILIKRKRVRAHAWMIVAALTTSTVFLACYISSYIIYKDRSSEAFKSLGAIRTAYLILLASHVILAVVMLPMIWMALLRAYRRQWDRHRKIAGPTFFIWFYVSVTGVVVYWMLYHLLPGMAQKV